MIYRTNYALRSPQYIPVIPFTVQELRGQKKSASEVGASLAVKINNTVR